MAESAKSARRDVEARNGALEQWRASRTHPAAPRLRRISPPRVARLVDAGHRTHRPGATPMPNHPRSLVPAPAVRHSEEGWSSPRATTSAPGCSAPPKVRCARRELLDLRRSVPGAHGEPDTQAPGPLGPGPRHPPAAPWRSSYAVMGSSRPWWLGPSPRAGVSSARRGTPTRGANQPRAKSSDPSRARARAEAHVSAGITREPLGPGHRPTRSNARAPPHSPPRLRRWTRLPSKTTTSSWTGWAPRSRSSRA